jgi:MFS family permease
MSGRLARTRILAAARRGPLGNRDFRLYGAGQLTSTIGDLCYAVALPWLVLDSHGGPVLLGTVLACYGVPRTVLIPFGGILADKIGPRTIMLCADVVRCAAVIVLAVLASGHTGSLPMLGPVAAVLGAGEGIFLPASYTIIPFILEPDRLQAGNGLSSAIVQVGLLTGPLLGGVLVTTLGPGPAFATDAASFAISAVALALIGTRRARAHEPHATAEPSGVPGVPYGQDSGLWLLLRRSRLLQIVVTVCVSANLTSSGALEVALPALAHARFGAAGYGAIIACFGGGSIAGTLAAARAGQLSRPATLAGGCFMFEAAAFAFMPFLGGLPGAAAAIVIFGACNGFGNIVIITLLQQWAPSRLLGRVMSLIMLSSMGTFPASVAISGVLVRHLGPVPFFPVAGAVLGFSLLGAMTQRTFRDLGRIDAEPVALGTETA